MGKLLSPDRLLRRLFPLGNGDDDAGAFPGDDDGALRHFLDEVLQVADAVLGRGERPAERALVQRGKIAQAQLLRRLRLEHAQQVGGEAAQLGGVREGDDAAVGAAHQLERGRELNIERFLSLEIEVGRYLALKRNIE